MSKTLCPKRCTKLSHVIHSVDKSGAEYATAEPHTLD